MVELERAWKSRESLGAFRGSEAVRVFHGPGEGSGFLRQVSLDLFGDSHEGNYWVSFWEEKGKLPPKSTEDEISRFLSSRKARSAVLIRRPEKGVPSEAALFLGKPPQGRFTVKEAGLSFQIQFLGTRHPGLFLDHAPLRDWLKRHSAGWKVLNTFAYTGSLSVACGIGGAAHVATLDLSAPTIQWAQENWKANALPADRARFVSGDFFEWVPKFSRQKERFDCVILDPPSFSRGKKGSFSTAKDLKALHEAALAVLSPDGILVTSINSANVTREKFESDVHAAARAAKRELTVLHEIQLPESFPTRLGMPRERYLKGWILKAR